MLYSEAIDNGDTCLVDMLSSVTGIKFNYEIDPPITTAQILTNYLTEPIESDSNKLHYDSSVMMNSDPMFSSTDVYSIDITAWKTKPVNEWTTEDVLFWVSAESEKAGLDLLLDSNMPNLCALTGANLIEMTLEDFIKKMSNSSFANKLYNSLQNNLLNPNNRNNINGDVLTTLRTCSLDDSTGNGGGYLYYNYSGCDDTNSLVANCNSLSTTKCDNDSGVESCSDSEQCYESFSSSLNDETWSDYTQLINNNNNNNSNNYEWQSWSAIQTNNLGDTSRSETVSPELDNRRSSSVSDDELSIMSDDKPKEPEQPVKKRPGRPRGIRKKKPEKVGRLWEFLRDLLHNPEYNPSIICWDNYDIGAFRFVHSEKVAQLWGSKKENPSMTFEKFSRAMRYYYKGKVLIAVQKRLVYRFGKNATGWRTPHPIQRTQL